MRIPCVSMWAGGYCGEACANGFLCKPLSIPLRRELSPGSIVAMWCRFSSDKWTVCFSFLGEKAHFLERGFLFKLLSFAGMGGTRACWWTNHSILWLRWKFCWCITDNEKLLWLANLNPMVITLKLKTFCMSDCCSTWQLGPKTAMAFTLGSSHPFDRPFQRSLTWTRMWPTDALKHQKI